MSDKELMTNYLSILKSNIEVYIHGTIESANSKVRDTLRYGLDETIDAQERCFKCMTENNMYEVSNIKASDVKKSYDKLCRDK